MGINDAKDPSNAVLTRLILELNSLRDSLNNASLMLQDYQFATDARKRGEAAQLTQAALERATGPNAEPPNPPHP
jgi:hypothetical protein